MSEESGVESPGVAPVTGAVPLSGNAAGPGFPVMPPPTPIESTWSGHSIASFVLGLFGLPLFGVIFGVLGLRRIRWTEQRGRGLAIAGIALSVVWFAAGMAAVPILLHKLDQSYRQDQRSQQGTVMAFDLQVGACFNKAETEPDYAGRDAMKIRLAVVACTQPHKAEVVGRAEAEDEDVTDLQTRAEAACQAKSGEYIMDDWSLPETARLHWFYPAPLAWIRGDRRLVCFQQTEEAVDRSLREDATTLTADQVRYLGAVHDVNDVWRRMPDDDPAVPWPSRRSLYGELATAEEKEVKLLQDGPWPGEAQPAITHLIEVKRLAIPLWRQASQAGMEDEFNDLRRKAAPYIGHKEGIAVRRILGLSTDQGEPAHRP